MLASESAPEASGSQGVAASPKPRRGWLRPLIVGSVVAAWLGTAWWHTHKPLPPGEHIASRWYTEGPHDIRFIADVTTADAYGRPVLSHAVFDEMLRVVGSAREFVVIDAFRFAEDSAGTSGAAARATPLAAARARPLAAELRDALIARKRAEPRLRVLFITDPVSVAYGSIRSPDLARLEEAGINVVVTDLDPLRDSNFLYSSLWRLAAGWWWRPHVSDADAGWLPSPGEAGTGRMTTGAWLAAANLKADRRNLIIADDGRDGLAGVLSATELSAAGGVDSNVAMRLSGPVLVPLLASEVKIARSSGWTGVLGIPTDRSASTPAAPPGADPPGAALPAADLPGADRPGVDPSGGGSAAAAGLHSEIPDTRFDARVLTEGAIRDALLRRIGATGAGDAIDIAAFYLSDRAVIEALVAASRRGAAVRLILDPGEDAFGRNGAGIPNRSVAGELLAASDGGIRVRWYRTHGERYHASLVMIYGPRRLWLTLGSANLTRRSLDDYDLDANVALTAPRDSALAVQALDYFETLWSNRAALGIEYTADVDVYADASQLHYWRYRLMEATGLSLF